MSEKQSKAYLMEKLWRSMFDGNPVMPGNAGNESINYYLNKINKTLQQYGGIKGITSLNPALATPPSTPPIIEIHLEEDLSEFTYTRVDGGDLYWTADAALAGTSGGMACLIDDTTAIYGSYTLGTANTSGVIRLRFYIDPNENNWRWCSIYD